MPWTRPEDASLPGGVTLVIVRAAHELVARRVRGGQVVASVGPTSDSGWTCVWLDEGDVFEPGWGLGEYLSLQETRTGGAILSSFDASGTMAVLRSSEGTAIEPSRAASMLARMFDAWDHQSDLQALFDRGPADATALLDDLANLLELPELEPGPEPGVILCNGDPTMVRLAAEIAGPACIASVEQGWLAIAPTPDAGEAEDLALAISTVVGRRDHTVVLSRTAHRSGVQLWSRGDVSAAWSWGGWEFVDPDREVEARFCELCTAIKPDIHQPTLRALLRRWGGDDPLAELTGLLGLPEAILGVVDATAAGQTMPDCERIERAPARRAWWAAVNSAATTPQPPMPRVVDGAFAVATVLAALACLAMTALGIAVIATNGSVVEQQGHSRDDWASTIVFALLTAILMPTAIVRIRRLLAPPRKRPTSG